MFPYEKLEVYKKAFEVNGKIYTLLKIDDKLAGYIKNQLGRASFSVMLNIAEGSGKFSVKDRRNFFVAARGSAFECGAILEFLISQKEIESIKGYYLKNEFEEISKILFVMIRNLEG